MIAVLVAISIPILTTQLDKAKDATNTANARSLYATLVADYLDDNKIDDTPSATSWSGETATITVGTNSFKFTKVDGASLTIDLTKEPVVTYKHCTKVGGSDDVFGAASTTSGS